VEFVAPFAEDTRAFDAVLRVRGVPDFAGLRGAVFDPDRAAADFLEGDRVEDARAAFFATGFLAVVFFAAVDFTRVVVFLAVVDEVVFFFEVDRLVVFLPPRVFETRATVFFFDVGFFETAREALVFEADERAPDRAVDAFFATGVHPRVIGALRGNLRGERPTEPIKGERV